MFVVRLFFAITLILDIRGALAVIAIHFDDDYARARR